MVPAPFRIPAMLALMLFLFGFVSGPLTNGLADEDARRFLYGVGAFQDGNYAGAIEAFEDLTAKGRVNPKLYYNLANTYLKNGDLGPAMLWYERAAKLDPGDPDLRFNLDYARSLVKDQGDVTASSIYRILFFWKYLLSFETICWLALGLNLCFWTLRTIWLFKRRRPLRAIGPATMFVAAVFILTALYNYHERAGAKEAIILPAEAAVRSGLAPDATELFVLHSGTKVRVEREKEGFARIRFTEDKIGWLPASQIGRI